VTNSTVDDCVETVCFWVCSVESLEQEFKLYDEDKEPIFHFSAILSDVESFVGMAKTVMNILPGVSPVKKMREDDYYDTYGANPFKENTRFLLGVLRMGKTIQISVTVECRLFTWEVVLENDPVHFNLDGDFVPSSVRGFISPVDLSLKV